MIKDSLYIVKSYKGFNFHIRNKIMDLLTVMNSLFVDMKLRLNILLLG